MSNTTTNFYFAWMWIAALLMAPFNAAFPSSINEEADLDPVTFKITSSKDLVAVDEEFEIKVVATKRPAWDLRLGQTILDSDFRLKVIFPDGFQETGGNYSDYVYNSLTFQKSQVEYLIKGKFLTRPSSASFIILRGTQQSVELGRYLYRGSITLNVKDKPSDLQFRTATVTDYNQCLEAESMGSATGGVTSDPNASNGQTRGLENQYNHYVDYVLSGVPSAGPYQVTLRYYSSAAPIVGVTVNGGSTQTINLANSGSWNIAYTDRTFNVNLGLGSNTIRISGAGGGSCRQDQICVSGGASSCTTPATPTIAKTSGITVCPATNQNVTLTSSGACGVIRWYRGATEVGTGTTYTVTQSGNYTATATVDLCTSTASSPIVVAQSPGCSASFSQCLESESMASATGAITSDPNASEGQTRGAENQYSHYVDYVLSNVPSAGNYQITLRYYSSMAPVIGVRVNGVNVKTVNLTNSGAWNIAYISQTFDLNLSQGNNIIRIEGIGGGSCRQDKICVEGGNCIAPQAPSIAKMNGNTVCPAINQAVTLMASGWSGTVTWFKNGAQIATNVSNITRNDAGSYTAICTVSSCVSTVSNTIVVTETAGCTTCPAPIIAKTTGTTVCASAAQSVILTASNCNGIVTWLKDGIQMATGASIVSSDPGTYTAKCTSGPCVSNASNSVVITQTVGCGTITGPLGAYSTVIGGREFTYNKTPEFTLQFNPDGTITDATSGLSFDGTTNKINNNRVYYQIGYKIFENANGTYNRMQNLYLPDGIYVIRQFICNENVIPNLAQFKSGITGWNNGVTAANSRLSEIFLSIRTTGTSNSSIIPGWLKVSRNFNFPSVAQPKNLATIDKFFCLVYQNRGTTAADYQVLGVNTDMDYSNPAAQPNTWNTVKWPSVGAATMTNQALYNYGNGWIQRSGDSKRFVLTDEIPENANGEDPSIYSRIYHFYKGAYDRLVSNAGVTDKRQTGLYGPYGQDNITINTNFLKYASRVDFEKSLTTHVHKIQDPATGNWAGDADYYTSGQINVRNMNVAYYLKTDSHYIPYELVYANERIKIGTKTYQNQDRESNWMTFSWHKVEPDLGLTDGQGNRVGIEYSSSGELIPFANGTILSKDNLEIPALWDEYANMAFWSTVVGKGVALWNGPGGRFGNDATKFNWWREGQQVYWTPTGASQENYVSQQNSSPETNGSGLEARLWSCPGDAAYAGMEAAWNIRDRIATLLHASYISSRGSFTANPGSAGLHLNGFGILNNNLFVVRDAFDAKKGLAIVGNGAAGSVIIYYNGFLSQHEYEDDVTVSGHNLGRVYGRQTVVKTY
jgi:hypothetical protein